jgi:hypothetical protein
MNLPDMSMTSAPPGAGQLDRVPAQAMRPSLITIDEFGVSPARGSTSVAPTSAKVAGLPEPLEGAGAGVVRQASGAAMAAARSSLIEVSDFSNIKVLMQAYHRSRYDLLVTVVKLDSQMAMRRHRSTAVAAAAFVLSLSGCATADWVMTDERQLVEAIFESPPFNDPISIEIDAKLPVSCQEVVRKRSPSIWVGLTESGLASMKPDGEAGCAILPVGRAAKAGGQIEWRVSGGGGRWRVPVGAYSIEGTNDDPVIMTRSFVGSTTVRFPWRFSLFTKLERVAGVRAVAAPAGHKGNAVVEFDRTDAGWRVSSISMTGR